MLSMARSSLEPFGLGIKGIGGWVGVQCSVGGWVGVQCSVGLGEILKEIHEKDKLNDFSFVLFSK